MSGRSTIATFQLSGGPNAPRTKTVLPTLTAQVEETPSTILANLTSRGQPLNESEVQQLESITYRNGSRVFDINQRFYFYEWANLLQTTSVVDVVDYLTSAADAESAFWNMASLDRARRDLEREIMMMQEVESGVRGIAKCGRCKSDNLGFSQVQTRSADEGFTTKYRCLDCGNRWTG